MKEYVTKKMFLIQKESEMSRYQHNAAFNAKIVKHGVNLVDCIDFFD